jgi:hypothetical protein
VHGFVAYIARVLRHARTEFRNVVRAKTTPHARLRDHVVAITVVTIGVDLVCALLALVLETGARHTQIKSYGSALFWTTTQLLTVSSQMPNPISTGGRILDVFMEVWAITVVASLAGSIGAFLVRRAEARADTGA